MPSVKKQKPPLQACSQHTVHPSKHINSCTAASSAAFSPTWWLRQQINLHTVGIQFPLMTENPPYCTVSSLKGFLTAQPRGTATLLLTLPKIPGQGGLPVPGDSERSCCQERGLVPPEHTNDLTLGLEKRPPEALQPCRVLGREHMLSPALQLFLCLHRYIPGTSRTPVLDLLRDRSVALHRSILNPTAPCSWAGEAPCCSSTELPPCAPPFSDGVGLLFAPCPESG